MRRPRRAPAALVSPARRSRAWTRRRGRGGRAAAGRGPRRRRPAAGPGQRRTRMAAPGGGAHQGAAARSRRLASRERTLLEDLRRLEVERDLRAEEFAASTARSRSASSASSTTRPSGLPALERTAESQLPDLAARMVELYKLGNGGYLRMLHERRRPARHGPRVPVRLRRCRASTAAASPSTSARWRTCARRRRRSKAAAARRRLAQAAVARARDAAAQAVAAHADLISRIDARRDLAAQLVGELEAARQAPAAHRRRRRARARRARPAWRWAAAAPLQGRPRLARDGHRRRRLRPAGQPEVPHVGRLERHPDRGRGRRRRCRPCTTARSPSPTAFTGFGNLVIVDHGRWRSRSTATWPTSTSSRASASSQGQRLGSVGTSRSTASPSLYFELRIDGKPVDPLQWLKRK